ncbi:ribosome small subunit-dependent GTPase A [Fulvivirga sp. M361]|uniref:ribosome small subunit-dependent GTPase A n=1 Tax=Fulvivirga sp. M361 TaxID=2594266 RepID=UPI00117AB3DB|nr:ribosome small subunit-dependent GTPase A [Fulvivirga sp. M361]TRX60594.1 ribosome small subunit-dependent GTPase A [Fulvivirga sp. M361]
MTYRDLGYNDALERYRVEESLDSFEIGRVVSEHKERYVVRTADKELDSELLGNLRFTAESRYDLPAVGDWVAISEYDTDKALIHAVYPRASIIERQAVGKKGQVQIIATNIDFGLIVQAVDRDFNLNRLERYLTICNTSNVEPIIVLSKIDLLEPTDLENIIHQIEQRVKDIAIIPVSNEIAHGYDLLDQMIQKGKTYCLLGSSGVGKSTLLNNLSGKLLMETGHISSSVNKGRHITSHRELIVLDSGGILIDNPGMREVGIADMTGGLETTFESILEYAKDCRFKDCTHMHEKGCAVLEAVENGEIDEGAYANFRKMEKEKMHFESDALTRKKKDKDLGKIIKDVKKLRKQHKF